MGAVEGVEYSLKETEVVDDNPCSRCPLKMFLSNLLRGSHTHGLVGIEGTGRVALSRRLANSAFIALTGLGSSVSKGSSRRYVSHRSCSIGTAFPYAP